MQVPVTIQFSEEEVWEIAAQLQLRAMSWGAYWLQQQYVNPARTQLTAFRPTSAVTTRCRDMSCIYVQWHQQRTILIYLRSRPRGVFFHGQTVKTPRITTFRNPRPVRDLIRRIRSYLDPKSLPQHMDCVVCSVFRHIIFVNSVQQLQLRCTALDSRRRNKRRSLSTAIQH